MNIAPGATRDIATDNDVGVLVQRFYRRAVPDPLLGPVADLANTRARQVGRALAAVARRQQGAANP